jgi:AcrR family transcriptional regulator
MTETSVRRRRLNPKGKAMRRRIVEAAASLICERGVAGANNELVRNAAGISGSLLSHYFPDKESLVRAVIAWQADTQSGRALAGGVAGHLGSAGARLGGVAVAFAREALARARALGSDGSPGGRRDRQSRAAA